MPLEAPRRWALRLGPPSAPSSTSSTTTRSSFSSTRSRKIRMPSSSSSSAWSSRRLLQLHQVHQLILLFLFLLPSLASNAVVLGTKRLYCMSCVRVESDTTALDQFRVRQGLTLPICDMEPVECEPHQDTCVVITMQITHRQFWVGSGCDQRVNYDFPSGGRDGCVELPAIYRNFHPGFMEERRTLQRLCLCSGNLCNSAPRSHRRLCSSTAFFTTMMMIPTAIILILTLIMPSFQNYI